MKKKIEFDVGILLEDEGKFRDFLHLLNEDSDEKFHAHIKSSYDDPDGYYTFIMIGTWEAYDCFLGHAKAGDFVKSLTHYEE